MGRADIHFAIQAHVQAHKRDGIEIDLSLAALRVATAFGPSGLVITDIEKLVAKAAEKAGVAIRARESMRFSVRQPAP